MFVAEHVVDAPRIQGQRLRSGFTERRGACLGILALQHGQARGREIRVGQLDPAGGVAPAGVDGVHYGRPHGSRKPGQLVRAEYFVAQHVGEVIGVLRLERVGLLVAGASPHLLVLHLLQSSSQPLQNAGVQAVARARVGNEGKPRGLALGERLFQNADAIGIGAALRIVAVGGTQTVAKARQQLALQWPLDRLVWSQPLDRLGVVALGGQQPRQGQLQPHLLSSVGLVGQNQGLDVDLLLHLGLAGVGCVVGKQAVEVTGQPTKEAVTFFHQGG